MRTGRNDRPSNPAHRATAGTRSRRGAKALIWQATEVMGRYYLAHEGEHPCERIPESAPGVSVARFGVGIADRYCREHWLAQGGTYRTA